SQPTKLLSTLSSSFVRSLLNPTPLNNILILPSLRELSLLHCHRTVAPPSLHLAPSTPPLLAFDSAQRLVRVHIQAFPG
ncbi:hypothetical protein BDY24DRAFT_416474, partial [Mrakia frigida]|uniref:uncharacterized protein n=1 Tax=Mrakia frigida TaxID=29902 RepID=UPI003FCBFD55